MLSGHRVLTLATCILLHSLLADSYTLPWWREQTTADYYTQTIEFTPQSVRLTGYDHGQLELYRNGYWQHVCTQGFNTAEGRVVCRQQGLSYSYYTTTYATNVAPYYLDCYGYESDIRHCRFHYSSYCASSNNAIYVRCYDDTTTDSSIQTTSSYENVSVRLVNGYDRYSGRVELNVDGSWWGTICDDSFDRYDAIVVCRMLYMYDSYYGARAYSNAHFGIGSGPIIIDQLDCRGNEQDISQCASNTWFHHDCSHSEDASVDCRASWRRDSTTHTSAPYRLTTEENNHPNIDRIRLVNGTDRYSGRVEVYVSGRWGTVCDDDFDYQDAKVICRMLGLYDGYYGVHAYSNAHFGEGSGQIIIDDLRCSGYEQTLSSCSSTALFHTNCNHNEDAGVDCRAYAKYTTQQYYWTTRGPSVSSAISVNCDENGWDVNVNMNLIRRLYPSAVASDIYLGENSCTGSTYYDTVHFRQGLRQCLTSEIVRGGVLVYTNELVYAVHDPNHPFIIKNYLWTVPIECDVERNASSEGHLHHSGHSVTSAPSVVGHSKYHVNMTFYRDPNFIYEISGNPIQVKVGSQVYVKMFSQVSDWTVKMRVHSCYTKPSSYAPDHMKYYIIKNGCEVDSNTHLLSQAAHETRFVFQDFEYTTNHEGIHLVCDAKFCDASDYSSQCSQTCNPIVRRSVSNETETEP